MAYSQLSYDPWETTPEDRKARFVGRETLLQRILAAIAEQRERQTLQHYLLLGPRGIGKTTLLLTLRERIREDPSLSSKWFCMQLREEEYFVRTLRDLLELTLQALAEDEGLPEAREVARQVHEERREDRSLAAAVDGLRALTSSKGKRILLLMDNFDRVFPATSAGRGKKRAPENEFRSLRKLLSTESILMVVGASVRLFEEIAAYDRAFFNFFLPVEVPELSEDEIYQLLRRCAEAERNTSFLAHFDEMRSKVRAITFMTGGNPRLVLMLYDVLRHHEMTPVVEALRETVGGLTPLLKHVLDDMPRQQSKTLDALVRLRGAAAPSRIAEMARLPLNVVTTQLGRLKEGRFVVSNGDGKGKPAIYRISDPMFQTWYQMRYLRPAGRRVELFVEFIRAWFSVEERRQFLNERWGSFGNGGNGKEAAHCVSRLHEFEPAKTPIERRLEARMDAILDAGRNHGVEAAESLLDAALHSVPEDVRARLEFLAPAIQFAKTGDEQALARLPEREREAAKQIAASLLVKTDS
jgi:DNA polymerase III delta prime subunit